MTQRGEVSHSGSHSQAMVWQTSPWTPGSPYSSISQHACCVDLGHGIPLLLRMVRSGIFVRPAELSPITPHGFCFSQRVMPAVSATIICGLSHTLIVFLLQHMKSFPLLGPFLGTIWEPAALHSEASGNKTTVWVSKSWVRYSEHQCKFWCKFLLNMSLGCWRN